MRHQAAALCLGAVLVACNRTPRTDDHPAPSPSAASLGPSAAAPGASDAASPSTPDLAVELAKVDEFVGALDALGPPKTFTKAENERADGIFEGLQDLLRRNDALRLAVLRRLADYRRTTCC